MKLFIVAAGFALLCLTGFAGTPDKETKSNAGFEKLKSLVGTWKGESSEGELTLTYKLVSGGSAIMETNGSEMHPDGMITMYHLDGDKLMMTHYCSMGNQPRMKAVDLTGEGKLAFSCVSGTNMTEDDAHMHALTITFTDNDHMKQEWTMRSAGKDETHVPFEMTRVQ